MNGILRSPWPGWVVALLLLLPHLGSGRGHGSPQHAGPRLAEQSSRVEVAVPSRTADDASANAPPTSKPLSLLRLCREQLAQAQAACEPGGARGAGASAGDQVELKRSAAPSTEAAGGAGSGGTRGAANVQEPSPTKPAGSVLLERLLDVPPEEARWLGQFVCAVRDLRSDALEQLARASTEGADPQELEAGMEDARKQRRAVLDDLRGRLGEERYERLRSIGGLGLIGQALDCDASGGAG